MPIVRNEAVGRGTVRFGQCLLASSLGLGRSLRGLATVIDPGNLRRSRNLGLPSPGFLLRWSGFVGLHLKLTVVDLLFDLLGSGSLLGLDRLILFGTVRLQLALLSLPAFGSSLLRGGSAVFSPGFRELRLVFDLGAYAARLLDFLFILTGIRTRVFMYRNLLGARSGLFDTRLLISVLLICLYRTTAFLGGWLARARCNLVVAVLGALVSLPAEGFGCVMRRSGHVEATIAR